MRLGNLRLGMPRQLQPELLDSLPAAHPDALRSRRDLRVINALMGNHRWLVRTLAAVLREGDRTLEIGAGTGELGRRLAAADRPADGLDLAARPADWPAGCAWHSADLLTFAGYGGYDAVIGNLIFHHFTDDQLAALGRTLGASVRVIVASEPTRSRFSQRLFTLLTPLFGANHVTRHDAHVSIAAGFRDDELPRLLGLEPGQWRWQCHTSPLGAYRLVAIRP